MYETLTDPIGLQTMLDRNSVRYISLKLWIFLYSVLSYIKLC